jgi:hypothetical protein
LRVFIRCKKYFSGSMKRIGNNFVTLKEKEFVLLRDSYVKAPVFQGFFSDLIGDSLGANVASGLGLAGHIGDFAGWIVETRNGLYEKIEGITGELSEGTKAFLDILILVLCFTLWCTFCQTVNGIAGYIASLLVSGMKWSVNKITDMLMNLAEVVFVADTNAHFQYASSSVLVSILGILGVLVAGADFSERKCMEYLKLVGPSCTVLEATIGSFSTLLGWLVYQVDPDCSLACNYKFMDEFDKVKDRIVARRTDGNYGSEMLKKKEIYESIKDDYKWFDKNYTKILTMREFDRRGREITELKKDLALQYEDARDANGLFKNRAQPICVFLHGEPGQGKSDIIPIIRKLIVHLMKGEEGWDYEDSDALLYTKAPTSKFFEGYREQPFMLLDDWGQINSPEMLAQSVLEMIMCINTAPAPLDMAVAESKGKYRFNSKVIFVSSNVTDFSVFKMADTRALARRITFGCQVKKAKTLDTGAGVMPLDEIDDGWNLILQDSIGDPHVHGLFLPQYKEKTGFTNTRTAITVSDLARLVSAELKKQTRMTTFADRLEIPADFQGFGRIGAVFRGWFAPAYYDVTVDDVGNVRDELYVGSSSDSEEMHSVDLENIDAYGLVERNDWVIPDLEFSQNMIQARKMLRGNFTVIDEDNLRFSYRKSLIYGLGDFFNVWAPRVKPYTVDERTCHILAAESTNCLARIKRRKDKWLGLDFDCYQDHGFEITGHRDCLFDLSSEYCLMDDICASDFIRICYMRLGKNVHLAMWDYMLKKLKDKGYTEVYYANANAGFSTSSAGGGVRIWGIQNYEGFEINSLNWRLKTRICLWVTFGIDTNLKTLALFGAAVTTACAAYIAIGLVSFWAQPGKRKEIVPSWFQKSSKRNEYWRGKRGRSAKKQAMIDRMDKEAYAINQADDVGIFQNPGEVQRSLAIMRNHYFVRFTFSNGEAAEVYGIFMDDRQFYFPWHAYAFGLLETEAELVKIEFFTDLPEYGVKTCMSLTEGFTLKRVANDRDLGAILLKKAAITSVSNIWGNVAAKKSFVKGLKFDDVRRLIKATMGGKTMSCAEGPYNVETVLNSSQAIVLGNYEDNYLSYYVAIGGKGEPGDCGFPYMNGARSDKSLLGLHIARCSDDSFVVPIFFEDRFCFNTGNFQTLPPGAAEKITPEFNNADFVRGSKCLGKWEGKNFSSPPKSSYFRVLPQMIKKYGLSDADEVKYPANVSFEARKNRIETTSNFGPTPSNDSIKMEKLGWSNDFASFPRVCEVLDFRTALFGDPFKEISSMATSSKFVGWAFDMKKTDLIDFDAKTCHPSLEKRVQEYWDQALSGPIKPLAVIFAKDELLVKEKVLKPECRLINGHDIAYNIVLRMLTGDLMEQMIKHTSMTACCIGTDPVSVDWDVIKTQAFKFENDLAGDISKQEATTTDIFRRGFVRFVIDKYNFSEENATRFVNLSSGLNGYYFLFEGHIYLTIRGHSSGHFWTTLFNSYQVWAAHKYIFEEACEDKKFSDHVALKVTGDDSRGSVSEVVKDKYNMQVLAKGFMDYFGMKYTSPDKKALEIPKFIVRDGPDDQFLGRTFTICDGRVLGRLRKVAVLDMLCYCVDVVGMTRKEVIQLRCTQAFREMSLYPKSEYDALRTEVLGHWNRIDQTKAPIIADWATVRKEMLSNWCRSDRGGLDQEKLKARALQF